MGLTTRRHRLTKEPSLASSSPSSSSSFAREKTRQGVGLKSTFEKLYPGLNFNSVGEMKLDHAMIENLKKQMTPQMIEMMTSFQILFEYLQRMYLSFVNYSLAQLKFIKSQYELTKSTFIEIMIFPNYIVSRSIEEYEKRKDEENDKDQNEKDMEKLFYAVVNLRMESYKSRILDMLMYFQKKVKIYEARVRCLLKLLPFVFVNLLHFKENLEKFNHLSPKDKQDLAELSSTFQETYQRQKSSMIQPNNRKTKLSSSPSSSTSSSSSPSLSLSVPIPIQAQSLKTQQEKSILGGGGKKSHRVLLKRAKMKNHMLKTTKKMQKKGGAGGLRNFLLINIGIAIVIYLSQYVFLQEANDENNDSIFSRIRKNRENKGLEDEILNDATNLGLKLGTVSYAESKISIPENKVSQSLLTQFKTMNFNKIQMSPEEICLNLNDDKSNNVLLYQIIQDLKQVTDVAIKYYNKVSKKSENKTVKIYQDPKPLLEIIQEIDITFTDVYQTFITVDVSLLRNKTQPIANWLNGNPPTNVDNITWENLINYLSYLVDDMFHLEFVYIENQCKIVSKEEKKNNIIQILKIINVHFQTMHSFDTGVTANDDLEMLLKMISIIDDRVKFIEYLTLESQNILSVPDLNNIISNAVSNTKNLNWKDFIYSFKKEASEHLKQRQNIFHFYVNGTHLQMNVEKFIHSLTRLNNLIPEYRKLFTNVNVNLTDLNLNSIVSNEDFIDKTQFILFDKNNNNLLKIDTNVQEVTEQRNQVRSFFALFDPKEWEKSIHLWYLDAEKTFAGVAGSYVIYYLTQNGIDTSLAENAIGWIGWGISYIPETIRWTYFISKWFPALHYPMMYASPQYRKDIVTKELMIIAFKAIINNYPFWFILVNAAVFRPVRKQLPLVMRGCFYELKWIEEIKNSKKTQGKISCPVHFEDIEHYEYQNLGTSNNEVILKTMYHYVYQDMSFKEPLPQNLVLPNSFKNYTEATFQQLLEKFSETCKQNIIYLKEKENNVVEWSFYGNKINKKDCIKITNPYGRYIKHPKFEFINLFFILQQNENCYLFKPINHCTFTFTGRCAKASRKTNQPLSFSFVPE